MKILMDKINVAKSGYEEMTYDQLQQKQFKNKVPIRTLNKIQPRSQGFSSFPGPRLNKNVPVTRIKWRKTQETSQEFSYTLRVSKQLHGIWNQQALLGFWRPLFSPVKAYCL